MPNDSGPQVAGDIGSMTAEQATAQLEELKSDTKWTAALANGDAAAAKQWNTLWDKIHGTVTPTPAKPDPRPRQFQATPVEPQPSPFPPDERPPALPGNYSFHMPTLTDEGSKAAAAEWQQTAYDVQLPAGMFTMISQQAEIDAKRGLDDDTLADNVDQSLHKLFPGDQYDRAAAGARVLVADLERRHPGLRDRLTKSGLNYNLPLLTWLMRKGLQR